MCTLSVRNVIYHKFSHGAAFYTLSGKNVNVMLESKITKALSVLSQPMSLPVSLSTGTKLRTNDLMIYIM